MCMLMVLAVTLVAAPVATAQDQPDATGGAEYGQEAPPLPQQTVPGDTAQLLDSGLAAAPELAPPAIQQAIFRANEIIGKPYRYGGGHGKFADTGYDCSGTVSFALNGGGLLARPLDSSSFMRWGAPGRGTWVTVFTNPGHAFAIIAGLRLDTSAAGDPSGAKGPRWRPVLRTTRGFKARHPVGL
jgi:hypothetical protein